SSIELKNLPNASVSDFAAEGQSVTGPAVKNQVNIDPTRLQVISTPSFLAAPATPATSSALSLSRRVYTSWWSRRYLRVAQPAAIASGFPDSVPAWYIGPRGATRFMI